MMIHNHLRGVIITSHVALFLSFLVHGISEFAQLQKGLGTYADKLAEDIHEYH